MTGFHSPAWVWRTPTRSSPTTTSAAPASATSTAAIGPLRPRGARLSVAAFIVSSPSDPCGRWSNIARLKNMIPPAGKREAVSRHHWENADAASFPFAERGEFPVNSGKLGGTGTTGHSGHEEYGFQVGARGGLGAAQDRHDREKADTVGARGCGRLPREDHPEPARRPLGARPDAV